jgi:hypothetical protein
MPAPVPHLVSMEVRHPVDMILRPGMFSPVRKSASISMVRIEMIVYVPVKVGRPAVPRTRADEGASDEPFRSVVAVRSARIRRVIEIAIRTDWGRTNSHANLRLNPRPSPSQENAGYRRQHEIVEPLQWTLQIAEIRDACVNYSSFLFAYSAFSRSCINAADRPPRVAEQPIEPFRPPPMR